MIHELLRLLDRKNIDVSTRGEVYLTAAVACGFGRIHSVEQLSRTTGISRRSWARIFRAERLAHPRDWLVLGRLMAAYLSMEGGRNLTQTSDYLGYPDPFTLSNQMNRVLGLRPSVARALTPDEFIECWIDRMVEKGRLNIRNTAEAEAAVA